MSDARKGERIEVVIVGRNQDGTDVFDNEIWVQRAEDKWVHLGA